MLKLNLSYSSSVNFAMQQNHVPIIKNIHIINEDDESIDDIKITLSFVPNLTDKIERYIDTISGKTTLEIRDMEFSVSSKYLSELTERILCEIVVSISKNDESVLINKYPIEILPFDQWAGVVILPEMLSAFVTPNCPAIATIIHRASYFLEKWTGSPSFDEYQSRTPDRVKKQMAAIYEAIAELNIVYCTPPASYELSGQRIRLCETILSTKLGTCLDMAVFYASCLEFVGINPLIVIVQGHAFTGGWLVDDTFADSVNDDVSLLTKRLANGINEIAVVETTCMNAGKNMSFDLAMVAAEDHLNDYMKFVLSVDIKRCRFASIRPLPQRIVGTDGLKLIEPVSIVRNNDTPEAIFQDDRVMDFSKANVTKQKLWERKLLDLTLRNNLLNIRLTKSTLQLISVNINLLEDALADGHEFVVLPKPADWDNGFMDSGIYHALHQTDPIIDLVKQELTQKRLRSYLTETELNYSLIGLYRSSRSSMEENGANTLYLALGLLKWYETQASERPRYAPILLLPVEIVRKSASKGYVIRSREEEIMMNITLLEMLRQDFGVNIGGLEILPKDDSGVDVKLVFNIIRKGIMNQKRWNVEEQAILGIFSFSKFIMWNDIHNNAAKLCKNKIVKSLVSGMIEWEVPEDCAINLDKDFKPSDVALPISADSFQMEAVCHAAKGKSFILHGPPGTGKSQTITNIIADALYHGKKVLFVAEKMAALSVVQKRLSDIGLAPFCLELHSNKSKKTSVLEQLKITTEVTRKTPPEDFLIESERLSMLRNELSDYVELLHRKLPSGFSLYDALYCYSNLADNDSDFEFPNAVAQELTTSRLNEWRDVVEQIQVVSDFCGSIVNHPLRELKLINYSQSIKIELKDLLEKQITLLNKLKLVTNEILLLLGGNLHLSSYSEYKELFNLSLFLLEAKYLPSSLLKINDVLNVVSEIKNVIAHGIERDKSKEELIKNFAETIVDIDADRLLVDWNLSRDKWFLAKMLSRKKIARTLQAYSLNGNIEKNNVTQILATIIKYKNERRFIDSKRTFYAEMFGPLWEDWVVMRNACDEAVIFSDKIISLLGDVSLSLKVRVLFANNLSQGLDCFLLLHKSKLLMYVDCFKELSFVNDEFSMKSGVVFNDEHWVDEKLLLSERLLDNIEQLKDWCGWNSIKQQAFEKGLDAFVGYIISKETKQLIKAFNKAIYKSIINYIVDSCPTLANFNGKLFEDKIRKFKELTTQFEKLTREELFAKLAANIPSFVREASQSSEVGILQRNIRNNGRGMSIRKLFDTIPNLITRINPCMLMSPMSVAQYIDVDNVNFDLVIFDEASQMPTCEAIGAIARGQTLIVVGDPKQMPPTNFFSSNNVDEENLDKEDMESILDDCLALSMPSKYLLWHYRSKHESLIAFSNSQYYENKLLTFPSPDDIKNKVTFQPVSGFYDKGKSRQNRAEADAVVREILIRLSDHKLSKRSIGVVTFSSVQQVLIEDLLTEAFARNPELETLALDSSEPLFIKNLENVQGDERDVILFSVAYGPDKEGKISLNFGPLNREGGWRRLNVAVSRARYEMKVFSTLRADQIDLSRTSAEGVAGLKSFLEYAEKGKKAVSIVSLHDQLKNKSLTDIIANKIRECGYEVHTNIGCSGYRVDIGIVNTDNKSEYLLGILCDGYNYKSAKTVRDREIIQQDILRLLGWNIYRVWTMDWIDNHEKVISEIIRAINQAQMSMGKKPNDEINDLEISFQEKQITEKPVEQVIIQKDYVSYKVDYVSAPIHFCGVLPDEFTHPQWEELIARQIKDVIALEAPISREQLCRRVLSMWGISRIGNRIGEHFNKIFARMNLKYTGSAKERFFWRDEQSPTEYMNYRVYMTTASDISPEEVSVAVKEVLESQFSLLREDLIRETAKLFGYSRLGTIVEASMQKGIDKTIQRGFAKEDRGRVSMT
jgi:superfamily I DNA and/or RNA helicase/very-short-patch-repair endonuclease